MLRPLRLLTPFFFSLDLLLVVVALWAAEWMRLRFPWGMSVGDDAAWLTGTVALAAAFAWALAFFSAGSHQARRVAESGAWRRLMLAHAMGALFFLAALFFLKVYDFSRLLVGYFLFVGALALLVRHGATQLAAWRLFRPLARRILLVGGGEVAEEVARRLQATPWGMVLAGVVATDDALSGLKRLGSLKQLSEVVRRHQIDDVMIALPAGQHALAEELILRLQADPVRVHFVPDVLQLTLARATVEDFFGIPVVGLREHPVTEAGRVAKRVFDLAAGSLLTLAAAPLMIGCALAIWFHDRGPVFFRQARVGENGRPFGMLKFRSMVVNAEARLKDLGVDFSKLSQDNPVFKLKDDPRVTPVGRFMRRWSLDELPQFLNVLKGDMSLVGPRPEEAGVVARYSFLHRKRLAVKPGITGPMQVAGRGDLTVKQRVSLEVAYIETWTLWSDLKILAKTLPVVLWGKGAY